MKDKFFRFLAALSCFFIPVGLIAGTSMMQHVVMVVTVLIVLITGLVSVAINRIVDRVFADQSSNVANDVRNVGYAAVLLALIAAAFAWVSILFLWK